MLLAVEDAVSEAIARKLVASVRPDLRITAALGRQGSGYLRGRARELNRSAAAMRVLLLTDLDSRATCPADVIMSWFGTAVPKSSQQGDNGLEVFEALEVFGGDGDARLTAHDWLSHRAYEAGAIPASQERG